MFSPRNILIGASLFASCALCAQNEVRKDSVSFPEKENASNVRKPFSGDSLLRDKGQKRGLQTGDYQAANPNLSEPSEKITYPLPAIDYLPQTLWKEKIPSRFPYASDFSHAGLESLRANSWLSGTSEHKTTLTFGSIQQTAFQYNRLVGNRLLLSGGLLGQKYEIHEQRYGNLEANLAADWLINDRLSATASGSYAVIRNDARRGSMMTSGIPSEISGGRTADLMPLQQAKLGLTYQMTDWLTLSGGTYIHTNSLFGQNFTDYGLNSDMNVQLNDRLNVRMFGTYSLKGAQNLMGQPPLYPENSYGGAIEYRISDNFGLGAGAERSLNPITGKWQTNYLLYPIFYGENGKKRDFEITIKPKKRKTVDLSGW